VAEFLAMCASIWCADTPATATQIGSGLPEGIEGCLIRVALRPHYLPSVDRGGSG
jgi:hypothetical protein